jgi:hypothetical protein
VRVGRTHLPRVNIFFDPLDLANLGAELLESVPVVPVAQLAGIVPDLDGEVAPS